MRGFFAFGALLLASTAAAAVDVAMPIAAREDAFVAALTAEKVVAKRDKLPNGGSRFTYRRGADVYTVDTAPWPALGAPETQYQKPSASDPLTVTHVHVAGPSSDQKRRWMKSFERDGRAWVRLADASPNRTAEEKKRYGVSAYMQWWDKSPDPKAHARVPSVTWLFQSERPPNTPFGTEPTILDVYLENPWHPRRF
jgi:hypothetical protein